MLLVANGTSIGKFFGPTTDNLVKGRVASVRRKRARRSEDEKKKKLKVM